MAARAVPNMEQPFICNGSPSVRGVYDERYRIVVDSTGSPQVRGTGTGISGTE